MPHGAGKGAVDGVIFEQMGQGGVVRAGIDGGDDHVLRVRHETQQVTTDATKTIDTKFDGHCVLLLYAV